MWPERIACEVRTLDICAVVGGAAVKNPTAFEAETSVSPAAHVLVSRRLPGWTRIVHTCLTLG